MSASVNITTNKKENILTIPLQSITTRKIDGDTTQGAQKVFIYNSANNKVEVREIETGIQDMSQIEVTKGLSDSVKIVTAPYSAISRELKNNSTVNIK